MEESQMEGHGDKALPEDKSPKKGMTKMLAIIVVIILVIAAIGVVLLMQGKTNVAPTASLTASASVVDDTTAVQFNASASHGNSGATIQYYLWNFGDGSTIGNTTTPTVTHTFTGKPGLYQVLVTVVDSNGLKTTSWAGPAEVQVLVPIVPAETTNAVTLTNVTTAAWLNASAIKVTDPANSTSLWIIWDFGDGTNGNTTSNLTSHLYAAAGTYRVTAERFFNHETLNATNATVNTTLSVSDFANPSVVIVVAGAIPATTTDVTPPTAITTVSSQVVNNNTVVTFTGNGSLGYNVRTPLGDSKLITNVLWHFGDGSADVSGKLSAKGFQAHTYLGNGVVYLAWMTVTSNYTVARLNVTTSNTVTSTYYMTIIVLPPSTAAGGVKNPDVFTTATIGEPQTLDPAWDYETSGGEILQNCYETLVFYNGGSLTDLKPVLCTQIPTEANGGISADGKNYTFTIRPNVHFHDGNLMTVDDVVYSFKRCLIMDDVEGASWMLSQYLLPHPAALGDPGNVSMAEVNASITSTATTVTFHLTTPCPAWLYILAFQCCSVVEKSWVQAHTPGTSPEQRWVGNKTVGHFATFNIEQQYLKGGGNGYIDHNLMGTGPFMLKTWAPNQYIVMQRWDGYWGVAPALKYVVIQKVSDVGTREMLLLSGQADSVYIPRSNTADVQGKPGVRIVSGLPTLEIDFFGMNEKITPHLNIGNVSSTFFSDVHIRQAFVHAFDYNKYLRDVMLNTAIQPNGPIPLGMLGYDPTTKNVTFNLTYAAEQLKLANNPGVPGKTYAQTGFSVVLYYNEGNTARQAGCQLLKDGLEQLSQNASAGITGRISVTVGVLDWPTYLDARSNYWLPMFFLGWLVDYPDPDDFAAPFCDQNGAFPVRLGIVNDTLTALVHQAATELNKTLRVQLYAQITKSCYDNAYYLWTTQPTTFHVERTWVNNYVYNPAFANFIYSYFSKG
jgi:peptide/nickel transport system substrate-binding protein